MASSLRNDATQQDTEATTDKPTSVRIQQFVNGETLGHDVLGALYDHILDEPVPQRFLDLLKK